MDQKRKIFVSGDPTLILYIFWEVFWRAESLLVAGSIMLFSEIPLQVWLWKEFIDTWYTEIKIIWKWSFWAAFLSVGRKSCEVRDTTEHNAWLGILHLLKCWKKVFCCVIELEMQIFWSQTFCTVQLCYLSSHEKGVLSDPLCMWSSDISCKIIIRSHERKLSLMSHKVKCFVCL